MNATEETRAPRGNLGSGSDALVARINRVVHAQPDQRGASSGAKSRVLTGASGTEGIHFSNTAAEAVVRHGLKARVLAELSDAAHIDVRHLLEFAGIDRTTVSRRVARDDVLPHEASVKAMQFTELVATAVGVFGSVEGTSIWLTRPHPLLEGETPMQRARTPWGLQRVRSMLGALKYGGAV